MTAPNDLDRHLTAAAGSLDVPAGNVQGVLERGRSRADRGHQLVAGLTVLVVVAITAVAVSRPGGGGRGVPLTTGAGVVRGDLGMVWERLSPGSGLGYASSLALGGPLYALSTAPGQTDFNASRPPVVWRSEDGVDWTSVGALTDDLYLSKLSVGDGRVYAVGTGPATASVGGRPVFPLLAGWSADGAKTWSKAALPVDMEAIARRSTMSGVASTEVAVGPKGVVVVAVLNAQLDVAKSLPEGVTAPNGWATTSTGIDLLGPFKEPVCPPGTTPPSLGPIATVAPPEAPLTAPATAAGTSPPAIVEALPVENLPPMPPPGSGPSGPTEVPPSICVNKDQALVSVSPQEERGVTASYTWEQLKVDGDLLRAVRHQPFVFFSPAASERSRRAVSSFERVDVPELGPTQGSTVVDATVDGFDLVVMTGDTSKMNPEEGLGTVVLHSDDGRTWSQPSAVPGGIQSASAAGRVGDVLTVLGEGKGGASMVQADGAGGWKTTSLADVVDADARRNATVHLAWASIGPFGVAAVVAIVPSQQNGDPRFRPEYRVLISRDGRTWGDESANTLAGRPVNNVVRALVLDDRVAVTMSVATPQGKALEQLVLVGRQE